MIVKVQKPLYPSGGDALIYDRQRIHMEQRPLTDTELEKISDEFKVFFTAIWDINEQTWILLKRVSSQQW